MGVIWVCLFDVNCSFFLSVMFSCWLCPPLQGEMTKRKQRIKKEARKKKKNNKNKEKKKKKKKKKSGYKKTVETIKLWITFTTRK